MARQIIEYGLAVLPQGAEAKKLKLKLVEIRQRKHEEWIVSKHRQTKAAKVKGDWKMMGESLLGLKEAGVELTHFEERTLQKAAWQTLYDQNSPFYRWISWLRGELTWFNSLVGVLAGLVETSLLLRLLQEGTIWGAPIYAVLIALNLGLVKSLARQHTMRILTVHFIAGGVTAGLLLLARSLYEFPPSDPVHYVILIVTVAPPLASVVCFEMGYTYEKVRAGIVNGFFTLIGGSVCALLGWVLATLLSSLMSLPDSFEAYLGLGLGWTLVTLIMEISDPALYGVNLRDVYHIFRR